VPEWAVLKEQPHLSDDFLDWATAARRTYKKPEWYAREIMGQFVDYPDASMGCSVPGQKRMERNFHKEAVEAWWPSKLILMQSENACETCPFSMLCLAHEPLGCEVKQKEPWHVHDNSPQYYPCGPTFFPFHCPRCHCFFFTMKAGPHDVRAGVRVAGSNEPYNFPYCLTMYCCPHLRTGKWDRRPLRENGVPLFPGPTTAEGYIMQALFGSKPNASIYEPTVACSNVHRVSGKHPEVQWSTSPLYEPEHPSNLTLNRNGDGFALKKKGVEVSSVDCLSLAASHKHTTHLPSDPWKYVEIEVR
jgi:hypothetical protein